MNISESRVQRDIRLFTDQMGGFLWRNNSGVAREIRDDGQERHVRYGLGNDSPVLNRKFKSSDLIGITPIEIEIDHVGQTWGVFTALEIKNGQWGFKNTLRENAQLNFIHAVREKGGIAAFINRTDQYRNLIAEFIK